MMSNKKFQAATYPTVEGNGIRNPCYSCARLGSKKTNAPSCYIKSRHYFQPWTDQPNYYLDMTQPFIGGRPVRQASHVNAIPRTLKYDTVNFANRNFYCQQPYWGPCCM